MSGSEFTARKQLGTAAETALRDLLTSYGAVVLCNQVNRDAVEDRPGAAVAHQRAGHTIHLPDLTVFWPSRGTLRSYGIEAKTKTPLANGGGWGWDRTAFDRAVAWSNLTGEAVFYCIRDRSNSALPPAGILDSPDHWHVASVWKLLHSPLRSTIGRYHYWPNDEFVPLVILLDGSDISAATVPYIPLDGGQPPLVL